MAMLTTKDVCDQLSISRSSVGRLVTDGELPCYKLGKSLRYYQSDVDAYVERCRIAAAPAAVCAPQPEKRKRGRPIKNAVPEYYPGMRVV